MLILSPEGFFPIALAGIPFKAKTEKRDAFTEVLTNLLHELVLFLAFCILFCFSVIHYFYFP
jgi:hypothetical protein